MIKVSVCIGSACHLKGARAVVNAFQEIVKEKEIVDQVDMNGTFCLGKCCGEGVSVMVNDVCYSVKPENARSFFEETVIGLLSGGTQ